MKKLFVFLSVFIALEVSAQYKDSPYSGLNESEVSESMREHIGFLSSALLEGRKAGSQGEKEAAEYVSDVLESYGVDLLSGQSGDLFGLKREDGDTLTSRNVIGFIPGYDRNLRNHYIVIGARLDNLGTMKFTVDGETKEKVFYGANGNASGLAMLMHLAGRLSSNRLLLKRSVIIAAFGSSLEMSAGSWYFLNRSFKDVDNIDAMINLDMLGTGSNGFYCYTSSNEDLNDIVSALSNTLQPVQPRLVSREPVSSDHRSFYEKEIPSILFTTGIFPEYNTERDTESIIEYQDMERELEYIYYFSISLANGNKPDFRREDETRKKTIFEREVVPYYECDTKPVFLGSSDPAYFLKKWVYVYLRYPEEAVRDGIQGRVLVDFIIDEKGRITDVTVRKGVDPLLDEEAVRVIKAAPDWKPGKVNGVKVKAGVSVYVDFKLKKR